jgi:hypothetical protein
LMYDSQKSRDLARIADMSEPLDPALSLLYFGGGKTGEKGECKVAVNEAWPGLSCWGSL